MKGPPIFFAGKGFFKSGKDFKEKEILESGFPGPVPGSIDDSFRPRGKSGSSLDEDTISGQEVLNPTGKTLI